MTMIAVQVSPEDPVMLVLSWHFRAATMCEFSKEEFIEGMVNLRCDSIQKLQQRLPRLRVELHDDKKFKVCPGTEWMTSCCTKTASFIPYLLKNRPDLVPLLSHRLELTICPPWRLGNLHLHLQLRVGQGEEVHAAGDSHCTVAAAVLSQALAPAGCLV